MNRQRVVWRAVSFALAAQAAAVALSVGLSAAAEPTAELRSSPAPYYAGVPITLEITASGFEADPQPELSYDPVEDGRVELRGVSPSSSSFMQIINGRIIRRSETKVVYSLTFTPERAGHYRIGPFHVTQGNKRASAGPFTVKVGTIPLAASQRIRLVMPDGPYVVGQRVPVTVEWWALADHADVVYNQRARVPLFDLRDGFDFSDPPRQASRITMVIGDARGDVEYPADLARRRDSGKQWIIRSVTRTMIPMQPGSYDVAPAELFVDEAVAFRRDLFGSRIPTRVRKLRAVDRPRTIEVAELPSKGRPDSFAGAVGEGFTLEVAADRSVVQVGDPIKLTLTLRGDGTVESASLPPLSADGGLSPESFRLPAGEIPGVFADGAKRFELSVRVLDPSVSEIPPIAFSWFNPAAGRYETTRSRPIALSVRPAQVVGASDVVTAKPETSSPAAEESPEAGGPVSAGVAEQRRFTLTGADLSIETDLERLAHRRESPLAAPRLAVLAYALSLLLLATGLIVRRRSDVDPAQRRRRRRLEQARRAVASARDAEALATALRALRALVPGRSSEQVETLLARLDEIVYAPGGQRAAVAEDLKRQATQLARTMVEDAE